MSMLSSQINRLKEIAHSLELFPIHDFIETSNEIRQAADTIEALSAKLAAENMERSDRYYNGGWILCSEKLPNPDESVLICFDFRGKRSVELGYIWSDGIPHCDSDEYLTPTGKRERKAVAWMELPKPYKGEP